MQLRKAVFPVAGLGTRFLAATKSIPKERLPIVDRPIIQYAVDEAIEAGCDTLIFVTGRAKRAVQDCFDRARSSAEPGAKGKTEALQAQQPGSGGEIQLTRPGQAARGAGALRLLAQRQALRPREQARVPDGEHLFRGSLIAR